MEKLLFTQRKTADSKSRVWKEILLALAVSLGVWLCLGRIFGLSWTPGTEFSRRDRRRTFRSVESGGGCAWQFGLCAAGKNGGAVGERGADPYAVFPGNGSLCLFPDPKQAAVDAVVFYGSLCSECDFPGQDGNCGDRCAGGGAFWQRRLI